MNLPRDWRGMTRILFPHYRIFFFFEVTDLLYLIIPWNFRPHRGSSSSDYRGWADFTPGGHREKKTSKETGWTSFDESSFPSVVFSEKTFVEHIPSLDYSLCWGFSKYNEFYLVWNRFVQSSGCSQDILVVRAVGTIVGESLIASMVEITVLVWGLKPTGGFESNWGKLENDFLIM